jgi:predicted O-methyltransferase YrrM
MIKSSIGKVLKMFNYQLSKISGIEFSQLSVIVPAECWKSNADDQLIDISLKAIEHARVVDHSDIAAKMEEFPHWPTIWPGEHYKLLSGIVKTLQPKLVVEIGTATGYSALSMKKFLPSEGRLITYDIVSWKDFPKCILRESDFADKRLEQRLADLSDPEIFRQQSDLLQDADLVFIDAAKDGSQEQRFIDNFKTLRFKNNPVFIFDDIRVMNMIDIWNRLDKPKLDLTSFGHWSGTGLVNWK